LNDVPEGLPAFLDYRSHLKAHSIYNTPPVFAIYVVMLVTRWLLHEIGGLENMALINQNKAENLYKTIDNSEGFYQGWAALENRSLMNVVFKLKSAELEAAFLQQAAGEGFSGLAGHRSLGGIRASIYNAMTPQAVKLLCSFMEDFRHLAH
jgi:phosphoserine aminotransferase